MYVRMYVCMHTNGMPSHCSFSIVNTQRCCEYES